jgi:uncharacterized protein (TIGR03032 family)
LNYDGSREGDQNGRPEAAGSEGPGATVPIVLTAQPGKDLLIPDGAWILGGQYSRQGSDLVVKGADGQLLVVRGFFSFASPPDLHTDGGAVINAQLATRLAGPLAPGEIAQTGPQAGPSEPIGKVTTATGVVEATRANGTKVTLKTGDPVYQGDILETGKNGAVGVEFADQSTFSLGDSGRMVLDEMVYDPGGRAQGNSFAMSLVQGTFSFVSGQISKTDPEAMVLNTPVATIGIRGTTIAGKVGGEGQESTLSLLPDPNGSTGEIVVSNAAGTVVLNTIGATVTVVSVSQPPPQPVTLSAQELASRYDNVLTINPAQPQAAPENAPDQGPPPEVINALNEIGEQLNKAVVEGLQQQQQHQIKFEQIKVFLDQLFRPPEIDPLPFFEQFKSIAKDYSGTTGELSSIIKAISAATAAASTAENVAAAKTAALLADAKAVAKSASLGLSASQAETLGSELGALATAPLKSLGAAAAISSTASSLSKAVLAAAAAAAKGETISSELIAELTASANELTTVAARITKIVTAVTGKYTVTTTTSNGVTTTKYVFDKTNTPGAADKVLTQVKTAAETAKANGQDATTIATTAKNTVATNFKTVVTSQLASDQDGDTDIVQFNDLSTIVDGVKSKVQAVSAVALNAGGGLALMRSALSVAESAATKAAETAAHAKTTMDPADVAEMLSAAQLAIQAATDAETLRGQVDQLVVISDLQSGIDPSALAHFLDAVDQDSSAETHSTGATAAIKAAVESLEAAQDFIDGTLAATLSAATTGERESFVPLWKPPFISKLAAEDRCHLNGLAMVAGRPKYVTAVGEADVADGWRDKRNDGGVVLEVPNGRVVAAGLSMPHSPRVHEGKLWLLNSGTGELGFVEPKSGRFEAVAFCPGYMRGLSFHGDYAIVGLSRPRERGTFSGLALDDVLAKRNADAQCGIYVIDLRSGDAVYWLRIDGIVQELYDVVFLPGVRRPMAYGFKSDEIRRTLNVGGFGTL